MAVPFLGAKEQRRKNKFAEKIIHSGLQVNGGSCEITKLRCQETMRVLVWSSGGKSHWLCRVA